MSLLSIEEIAKAKEELVLQFLTDQARLLEEKKAEGRATAKARGMTDAEIDAWIPPHPTGSFSI